MEHLHDRAVPLMKSPTEQVGWHLETDKFTLEAIQRPDQVKVYVYWGNETTEESTWFIDWEGVRRYLAILQGN